MINNNNNNNNNNASLWTKLTTGLDSKPSTDFEVVLAQFDELNKIRGQRKHTQEESDKYRKMVIEIDTQFQKMFTDFDKNQKRLGKNQQHGGAPPPGTSPRPTVTTPKTTPQTAPQAEGGESTSDNIFMNIWEWLKQKWNEFMESIKAIAEENQQKALALVEPGKIMAMFSIDNDGNPNEVSDKINHFNDQIKTALTSIQRTVTNGIGNAANASIDVLLNALSMVPVLGTALLTWRIFQNLLVIVGATMSVQATNVTVARNVIAAVEDAKKTPDQIEKDSKEAKERKEKAAEEAKAAEAKAAKDKADAEAAAKAKADAAKKTKGGGMRKTKKNTPNRPRKYGTVAAYAREIHRSLKRFHGLGLGAPKLLDRYTPSSPYPYALKLSSASTRIGFKPALKPVAAN
jgi:hypothetical protein